MKNRVIILPPEETLEEIYMSQLIEEEPWHREGVGNGLLAEQKSWQGTEVRGS